MTGPVRRIVFDEDLLGIWPEQYLQYIRDGVHPIEGFRSHLIAPPTRENYQNIAEILNTLLAGRPDLPSLTALQIPQPTPRVPQPPLATRVKWLVFNPLSRYWKWPVLRQTVDENPCAVFTLYPALYLGGMFGYALSLPKRVFCFVLSIFELIGFCAKVVWQRDWDAFWPRVRDRLTVIAGSFGEILTGVVGSLCPILGYKLDEKIQKSSSAIHYHSRFGLWNDEVEGEDAMGMLSNLRGAISNQRKRWHALQASHSNYYSRAYKELKKYIPEDVLDAKMDAVIYLIPATAYLLARGRGYELPFPECEAESERSNVEKLLGEMNKTWRELLRKGLSNQRIAKYVLYSYIDKCSGSVGREGKPLLADEEIPTDELRERSQDLAKIVEGITKTSFNANGGAHCDVLRQAYPSDS